MNIKKVIKAKGWTMESLASEMKNKNGEKGISQSSVSQLINGNPTLDKLIEIASIIGVSVSELLSDEEPEAIIAIGGTSIRCPHCQREIALKVEVAPVEPVLSEEEQREQERQNKIVEDLGFIPLSFDEKTIEGYYKLKAEGKL